MGNEKNEKGIVEGKRIVAISIAVMMIAFTGIGRADLPPPSFLPNSPLVAGSQIIVLWGPVPGAVKYNIYLDGKKVGESQTIQFLIPSPSKAGEYQITLSAVDAAGAESAKSKPGTVKIIILEPPKGLMYRYAGKKVLMRWDKMPIALIYNVYRSKEKDGEYNLLASVQEENYTDSSVAEGETYFYAVTSKDMAGKESSRSEPMEVKTRVEEIASGAGGRRELPEYKFRGMPTLPVGKVRFVAGEDLEDLSGVRIDPKKGEIVILKKNQILITRLDGTEQRAFPPIKEVKRLGKVDFGPDGTLYVTGGRYLYSISRGNGSVLWKSELKSPDLNKKEIWEGVPPQFRTLPPFADLVLCLEKEIWVMDPRAALFHVYGYEGKFLRHIYSYIDLSGKKVHLPPLSAAMLLGNDRILLGDSLAHVILCAERKGLKVVYQVGMAAGEGMTGKIIGVNGIYPVKDGTQFVVTDTAQQALQVFDENGKYLYHIGGDLGAEDKAIKGRAALDIGSTLLWAQFVNDKEFIVYAAGEKVILHRKLK